MALLFCLLLQICCEFPCTFFVADSKHFQNGLKEELLNRYIYSSRKDIKLGKINIYCIPQLIQVCNNIKKHKYRLGDRASN